MSRPSDDLDELIAIAEPEGVAVNRRQLRDWERQGALGCGQPTVARAERVLGVSAFLAKRHPYGERPDLPTRRRVADAAVWLWYDGHSAVPHQEIRERTLALLAGWDTQFAESRDAERRPGIADYETRAAVADTTARRVPLIPEVARQLRSFRDEYDHGQDDPPANVHDQLRDAYAQLFQVLQGGDDIEVDRFGRLMQSPLLTSGAIPAPTLLEDEFRALAHALSIRQLMSAVRNHPNDDWTPLQLSLNGIRRQVTAYADSGDPKALRKLGRHAQVPVTTGGLLFSVAIFCSLWPNLVAAVADPQ